MWAMVGARYDGHADWYDATFRRLGDEAGSAGLLARLLGPADADDPTCLDIGWIRRGTATSRSQWPVSGA
jgi:hypothetical protein